VKSKKMTYFKYFSLFFAIAVLVFITGCSGTPPAVPIINSFSASPTTITAGESSTLSWSVTDATSVTINHAIGSVALTGTTAVNPTTNTTYTLTATNGAGSVTATTIITVNPMATLTISQTEGTASAWFGASPVYVNVGQGQSFQVTEAGFFDQFQIYLSSTQSTDSGDIIVCDLRDSSGNVLQSASINGFLTDNEGWQIFNFNLGTYVTPGTYYCTCYISNPIEDHVYSIHGNNNDASYSGGTRYVSTGGSPEVWSSWYSESWDLLFKVIIKIIP
jgi:hypothetical protein